MLTQIPCGNGHDMISPCRKRPAFWRSLGTRPPTVLSTAASIMYRRYNARTYSIFLLQRP